MVEVSFQLQAIRFSCYDMALVFKTLPERFVPYSLRVQIRDDFDHLGQGSMTIVKHDVYFYTLSRYATTSIFIELERIKKFVKGLVGYYQLATSQIVISGASFQSIVDYARMIELICQITQSGGDVRKSINKVSSVEMLSKQKVLQQEYSWLSWQTKSGNFV